MRTIVAASLVAFTIGIFGSSSGLAAPGNGAALKPVADAASLVAEISYYRRHGRLCYSKCYREFIIGRRVCRRFC